MQIPGGDLAPARRRRYGGGYGRRRRRRYLWLGLVAIALLAAGSAYALRTDHPTTKPKPVAVHRCPSARPSTTSAALPAPQQVRLRLLNGTSRNGLAKSVKAELTARGFVVVDAANAPAALPGPSRVVYGPAGLPAATLVSRYVRGAVVVSDPAAGAGTVQVTLGGDYQRLATPAEVATAAPLHVPSPSASPCV